MKTVNFYKLLRSEFLLSSISLIANKILETEEKLLIFFENPELMAQIDEKLWSFSQSEFIPHAREDSAEFEEIKDEVPILLTTSKSNIIGAENLMIFSPHEDFAFFEKFNKTAFIFSSEEEAELAKARTFWKEVASSKEKFSSKFYDQNESKQWSLSYETK